MKNNKWFPTLLTGLLLTSFVTIENCKAQIQKGIDLDGESADDYSGWAVSMPDANTIAIGAPLNDVVGSNAGQVRVYSWNGNAWVQKGLEINGENVDDQSGSAISMPDANTIAIGASGNDGAGSSAGHVRVYSWNGNAWTQKGLDIDGEASGDQSGFSVSMPNAHTVAIGALFNDGSGLDAGHVRVYRWDGTAWVQKGIDIDGEAAGDQSGYSISMPDTNTVAIGAIYNSGAGNEFGHVRVYNWDGTAWVQKGSDIDGETFNDRSGWSVSMGDANTVAIGARYNDGGGTNSGHVRIYQWSGTAWTQKGIDINGEAANDHSGWSVSMANANTLAISAIYSDGNGSDAGHVRIFNWNGNAWMQKGVDIDGEVAGDHSGYSVSMGDANTVAIGSRFNDGSAINAGHARVFSMCTPTTGTDTQTACGSYTWINGVTYTANNNTATHTLTNAAGCDSVVTLNLTIQSVDVSVTNAAPILTANATNATYQWLDCDANMSEILGETNAQFIAPTNGNYAVTVTQNGCTDTSTCYSITTVMLKENSALQAIRVYPNPASSYITVFSQQTELSTLTLLDNLGRIVYQTNSVSHEHKIPVSHLSNGLYLLQLETKQGVSFRLVEVQ
ncbi:MAG: T9SS type A sorting domain-containing protein [Bacteroidia bacterium]|nr:T9SS type A sorting domain-containing protein [Bacteroidia bacterium]MCZ2248999.1 T9SS type A sorting domain-containing protein [Bacteroidia bacterium]